ncbi:MAG TPA: nitronate monooxygenase [Polyangiaceae bacterium]
MPVGDFRELVRVERPVLQAALGGGLSRTELASAVSRAGGLGTVGIQVSPEGYGREIRKARDRSEGRPVAANLLLPVATRAHVEACIAERVPVVTLFFGFARRVVEALHGAGIVVLHQVGTVEQARRALSDGADGLIAQCAGAGGHVLAKEPASTFLPKILEIADGRPVIAAGGIHDRASARAVLEAGASAVSAGTRFLLTHESHAHPEYKERLLRAEGTLETLLFGLGWHALHRVVPNAATDRWCAESPLGPGWVRAANRATEPLTRRLPSRHVKAFVERQRIGVPFYTPVALLRGMEARLADVTPLYAGECVARVRALAAAADVVTELGGG